MNMGSNFSEDEDGCEKSLNAMEWHLESEAPYMTHHSFGFKFHFVNNQTDEAHTLENLTNFVVASILSFGFK